MSLDQICLLICQLAEEFVKLQSVLVILLMSVRLSYCSRENPMSPLRCIFLHKLLMSGKLGLCVVQIWPFEAWHHVTTYVQKAFNFFAPPVAHF